MSGIDYAVMAIYLIGLLALGVYCNNNRSSKDYFLAGRTLGWQPLTLSIMATQLSAISFISAPAFVGLREGGGLIWLSYELALPLAMLFLLWTILPMLHKAGVLSVYDYLEQRYGSSTRLVVSLVFQVSRSFATAMMIYAISIVLQGTMGIDFIASVILIGVVTIIYSLQGGMKAVVYGDAVQMVLIIVGALVCLFMGLHLLGGIEPLLNNVDAERLTTINFSSFGFDGQGFGFWPMLFGGFVLYASYYGCDQSEAQRALSAKNLDEQRKMLLAASLLRFPITLIYCAAGIVIGTFVSMTPEFAAQIPSDKPDWMMPIFIANYLPAGLTGLLLVAMLAAAMSSLSSAINSLSAVSVQDTSRLLNLKHKDSVLMGRFAGVFWGSVTLLLSIYAGDIAPTVIEAINKVGSVFYGPILSCFFLAYFDSRIKALHINVGIALGVFTNVYLWLNVTQVFWFWWNVSGALVTISVAYLLLNVAKDESVVTRQLPIRFGRAKDAFILGAWFFVILLSCTLISVINQ